MRAEDLTIFAKPEDIPYKSNKGAVFQRELMLEKIFAYWYPEFSFFSP